MKLLRSTDVQAKWSSGTRPRYFTSTVSARTPTMVLVRASKRNASVNRPGTIMSLDQLANATVFISSVVDATPDRFESSATGKRGSAESPDSEATKTQLTCALILLGPQLQWHN